MGPAGDSVETADLHAIAVACGVVPDQIKRLASGAQSEVWLLASGAERYVLRIGIARSGDRNNYESDYAIRRLLSEQRQPVAKPVATDADVETPVDIQWSLDHFVEGAPRLNGDLPIAACREVGRLLAALHRLPVEGYGRLSNRRDHLRGSEADPFDGFLSRLYEPWPFTCRDLSSHPLIAERPEFADRLKALEGSIRAVARQPPCILHTDLHRGQFLFAGERLAAMVDFGEATAGPAAWDIASFGYFFGWEQASAMLAGYTAQPARRSELLTDARHIALVIALHHAGRALPLQHGGGLARCATWRLTCSNRLGSYRRLAGRNLSGTQGFALSVAESGPTL